MWRVLIAEDHQSVRFGISQTLKLLNQDFEITEVGTGEDLLSEALAGDFDCIVADIRMPRKIDGLEAIRQIRQFSDVPILVYSAYDTKSNREKAKEVGATVFLGKPVHLGTLAAKIKGLCKKQSGNES